MFGLKDADIKLIKSVFLRYKNITKVVLYGSRAMGNYKNASDIDLTMFGANLNMDILLRIENELDDLLLPYNIDLSIYDKIENKDLKDHINRVGKVFYEKK